MTTPTPEAIEAGVASGMDTHDWELLQTQGDIGEAVEMAIRDALSVAAPFIAAQAKAEALREAAEVFGAGEWVDEFMAVTDDVSAVQATVKWLRARAATLEGKSE